MHKYFLTGVIESLSKEEVRSFKIYCQRINLGTGEKKLIQLFEQIREHKADEYAQETVNAITRGNKNSFYRIKNRLMEDLESSLLLQHRTKDEKIKLNNYLALSRIFSYKSDDKKALEYLYKAEKEALQLEYYDHLQVIYDQILELAANTTLINPADYLEKRNENFNKYQEMVQINSVIAAINYDLFRTNFSGKNKNIIGTLNQILTRLQFNENHLQSPDLQIKIFNCVKKVLLQKKDFKSLETYLINTYHDFEARQIYTKARHQDKVLILAWTVNTCFKNRKYATSLHYNDELYKALLDHDKRFFEKYAWLYYQGQIINQALLGKNGQAIEVLNEIKDQPLFHKVPLYQIFIYLNLASFHYCEGDLENALSYIALFLSSEMYDQLPLNWKLNISIVEMILHIENRDFSFAENRLRNIRRTFSPIINEEGYQREKEFLKILLGICTTARIRDNNKLLVQINEFIQQSPEPEPGSNESINYQLWLESKITGRRYYDLILEKLCPQEPAP